MQFPSPVAIKWNAEFIGANISGNADGYATGINEIHKVEPGDLVFVDHPKYYEQCINSAATFIIINKNTPVPAGKSLLLVDDSFEGYCKIVNHFNPFMPANKSISDSAVIGEGSIIYPSSFVG